MDYRAAFQISAAGMALEKLRVDVTALNLANMHTTAAGEAGLYRPLKVVAHAQAGGFETALQREQSAGLPLPLGAVEPTLAAPRLVHEPGHPHADAKGMVAYPGVDHAGEMVNLVSALRAYEANVAAAGISRALASKALEIGGGQ